MTTPGGVPNLPAGALTLDTLATKLQDMSGTAMKNRAVERFPGIMDNSTGLSPASDLTPFGILTRIWAEVNSLVANADPADINGPEDLPELVLEFIEGLPVVGQFVALLEVVLGTYDGDDPTLLQLQSFFANISKLIQQVIDAIVSAFTGGLGIGNDPSAIVWGIINQITSLPGQLWEGLLAAIAGLQSQVTALQNNPGTGLSDDFRLVGVGGYTNIAGALAISSRGPYIQSPSLTAGYRNAGPATDRHGAQIIVTAKMRGTVRLGICSDTTASNWAGLELYSGFDGDAARIITGSSPSLTVVRDQLDFVNPKMADLTAWDIWYDPTANKFYVLRNGQDAISWPDSTNVVTHGSAKRRIIVISNGLNDSRDGMWGFGIQKVIAYDR